MHTVTVEALNLETFASFGTFSSMLQPNTPHIGAAPISFYRDAVPLELGGKTPSFSSCRVEARAFVIDVMEYHSSTGEGILALDGDVLVQLAPATPPGDPFPFEHVRVFRVPQGTLLAIRPGVWHHAPFAIGNRAVNVLIVLPERTYANDCVVLQFQEAERIRIAADHQ